MRHKDGGFPITPDRIEQNLKRIKDPAQRHYARGVVHYLVAMPDRARGLDDKTMLAIERKVARWFGLTGVVQPKKAKAVRPTVACIDCGAPNEMTGHQTCQYPGRFSEER